MRFGELGIEVVDDMIGMTRGDCCETERRPGGAERLRDLSTFFLDSGMGVRAVGINQMSHTAKMLYRTVSL